VRSEKIEGYRNLGPIYEWSEGKASLIIDRVTFNGRAGAILCYYNPPVHQVGNPELPAYWKEAERSIKKCKDAGIKMCGTVSTIWGSPISGPTRLEDAVEFTRRWLAIGADDIEHADHDGSAPPDQVYRYFSMLLDAIPNPELHVAHFHVSRGWGLANVLAALQAGVEIFEGTLGGIGGQPTNFLDRTPVPGTGAYYYKDPNVVGLVTFEDMCVMLDEMGIDLCGIDIDRILEIGTLMEKTIGRRLRSESILNGRIPKEPREEFKRPKLASTKEKSGEKPGQIIPDGWPEKAEVPKERLVRSNFTNTTQARLKECWQVCVLLSNCISENL